MGYRALKCWVLSGYDTISRVAAVLNWRRLDTVDLSRFLVTLYVLRYFLGPRAGTPNVGLPMADVTSVSESGFACLGPDRVFDCIPMHLNYNPKLRGI